MTSLRVRHVALALGVMASHLACTDSRPPELVPVWRWEIEPLAAVRTMVRTADGGAVLTLWGSYWSVVRLTAAGAVQWAVPLPIIQEYGPSVTLTGDGTAVAVYPTSDTPDSEPSCRAIRLDDSGAELAAYDYAYGCSAVVGAPDGGFVIGTGGRQAGQPLEPHDIVSLGPDGAIRWAVALGGCRNVGVLAGDGDQLFAGRSVRDCDADGQPIPDTNRPWLGGLDLWTGALDWEHEGEIADLHQESTLQVAPLQSSVVAMESNLQGEFDVEEVSRLRSVDRADGTERWLVESAGRAFGRIGVIGGAHVVAGGVEHGARLLWMFDENGDEVGSWVVERYFMPDVPLAAAEDRSVLVFTVSGTEGLSGASVDRYDLPP